MCMHMHMCMCNSALTFYFIGFPSVKKQGGGGAVLPKCQKKLVIYNIFYRLFTPIRLTALQIHDGFTEVEPST